MTTLISLAAVIPVLPVVSFLAYGVLAISGSTKSPISETEKNCPTDDLFFIFMVPCLNEELVIKASLERLFAIPGDNWVVMVIDDGSDDATAEIVRSHPEFSNRVNLLQRRPPQARQGKGAALNAAYHHLRNSPLVVGRDPDNVLPVVVDADGRLEPNALATVAPLFKDPRTAAVQIGVRMYNRSAGWLARMQDMEFLVFTEIFQRARQRYGNAGLGGNGQFVRLSALYSLGQDPWTDYLTEDLDMGLRLQACGWRTAFTPDTYVSQEGLTRLRPLLRQRTRWYQGHLQCWSRIPSLLNNRELSVGRTVDLMVYLVSPISVLLITLSLLAFLPSMAILLITQWQKTSATFLAHHALLVWWYLLVLGVIPLIALLYSRASMRTSEGTDLRDAFGYAFLFAFYAYMWLPVAWRATWRLLSGRRTWAKTARLTNQPLIVGSAESC